MSALQQRRKEEQINEFLDRLCKEIDAGRGIVPLFGAGISAAAGIPVVAQLTPYLNYCVNLSIGNKPVNEDDDGFSKNMEGYWNPRFDPWPPIRLPFEDNEITSDAIYNGARHSKNVFKEAMGATADWRTALNFLSRIQPKAHDNKQLGIELVAPEGDVIDDFCHHIVRNRQPTLAHRLLASLRHHLRLRIALTTNFDELYEEAMRMVGQRIASFDIHYEADLPSAKLVLSAAPALLKLHGGRYGYRTDYSLEQLPSADDRRRFTSYVLGRYISRDEWELRNITSTDTSHIEGDLSAHLLIMGISGNDQRIISLLKTAASRLKDLQIFWIAYSGKDLLRAQAVFGDNPKVHILQYQNLGLLLLKLYQKLTYSQPLGDFEYPSGWRIIDAPFSPTYAIDDEKPKVQKIKQSSVEFLGGQDQVGYTSLPKIFAEGLKRYDAHLEQHFKCIWFELASVEGFRTNQRLPGQERTLRKRFLQAIAKATGEEVNEPSDNSENAENLFTQISRYLDGMGHNWFIVFDAADTNPKTLSIPLSKLITDIALKTHMKICVVAPGFDYTDIIIQEPACTVQQTDFPNRQQHISTLLTEALHSAHSDPNALNDSDIATLLGLVASEGYFYEQLVLTWSFSRKHEVKAHQNSEQRAVQIINALTQKGILIKSPGGFLRMCDTFRLAIRELLQLPIDDPRSIRVSLSQNDEVEELDTDNTNDQDDLNEANTIVQIPAKQQDLTELIDIHHATSDALLKLHIGNEDGLTLLDSIRQRLIVAQYCQLTNEDPRHRLYSSLKESWVSLIWGESSLRTARQALGSIWSIQSIQLELADILLNLTNQDPHELWHQINVAAVNDENLVYSHAIDYITEAFQTCIQKALPKSNEDLDTLKLGVQLILSLQEILYKTLSSMSEHDETNTQMEVWNKLSNIAEDLIFKKSDNDAYTSAAELREAKLELARSSLAHARHEDDISYLSKQFEVLTKTKQPQTLFKLIHRLRGQNIDTDESLSDFKQIFDGTRPLYDARKNGAALGWSQRNNSDYLIVASRIFRRAQLGRLLKAELCYYLISSKQQLDCLDLDSTLSPIAIETIEREKELALESGAAFYHVAAEITRFMDVSQRTRVANERYQLCYLHALFNAELGENNMGTAKRRLEEASVYCKLLYEPGRSIANSIVELARAWVKIIECRKIIEPSERELWLSIAGKQPKSTLLKHHEYTSLRQKVLSLVEDAEMTLGEVRGNLLEAQKIGVWSSRYYLLRLMAWSFRSIVLYWDAEQMPSPVPKAKENLWDTRIQSSLRPDLVSPQQLLEYFLDVARSEPVILTIGIQHFCFILLSYFVIEQRLRVVWLKSGIYAHTKRNNKNVIQFAKQTLQAVIDNKDYETQAKAYASQVYELLQYVEKTTAST